MQLNFVVYFFFSFFLLLYIGYRQMFCLLTPANYNQRYKTNSIMYGHQFQVSTIIKLPNSHLSSSYWHSTKSYTPNYLLTTVLCHGKHGSHLCTNQCRCIDHVDRYVADSLASFDCLFHTLLGQRDIDTACEQVLFVPQWLAMPNQNQSCFTWNGYGNKKLENFTKRKCISNSCTYAISIV